jgi:hypothetical protein
MIADYLAESSLLSIVKGNSHITRDASCFILHSFSPLPLPSEMRYNPALGGLPMPGKPRTVSDEAVRVIADYAGLNLPGDRIPLLREQIENVLKFTQQWEAELDMLNTRPAHLYRIPWEVSDPLAGPGR